MHYKLSANYVTLDIQYLSHLQNGVDMMTNGSSHMVRRTGLAPLVDELTARQRELGTHVSISKHEDGTFLIDTLGSHKLEDAVLVLRDSQIGPVGG